MFCLLSHCVDCSLKNTVVCVVRFVACFVALVCFGWLSLCFVFDIDLMAIVFYYVLFNVV